MPASDMRRLARDDADALGATQFAAWQVVRALFAMSDRMRTRPIRRMTTDGSDTWAILVASVS